MNNWLSTMFETLVNAHNKKHTSELSIIREFPNKCALYNKMTFKIILVYQLQFIKNNRCFEDWNWNDHLYLSNQIGGSVMQIKISVKTLKHLLFFIGHVIINITCWIFSSITVVGLCTHNSGKITKLPINKHSCCGMTAEQTFQWNNLYTKESVIRLINNFHFNSIGNENHQKATCFHFTKNTKER